MSLVSRLLAALAAARPLTRDIATEPLRIRMRDGLELLADRTIRVATWHSLPCSFEAATDEDLIQAFRRPIRGARNAVVFKAAVARMDRKGLSGRSSTSRTTAGIPWNGSNASPGSLEISLFGA